MAQTFIGKPISLISHSDVRYRGILAGIDPHASTIQLSNVYSMGTETRRPPEQYIPPIQEPYQYIIFRASEVKDLSVDDAVQAPPRRTHEDPAILAASAPVQPQQFGGYGVPGPQNGQIPPQQQQQFPPRQQQPVPQQQGQQPANNANQQGGGNNRRNGSVNSARQSLETVERALGDLRIDQQQGGGRGGRRNRDIKAGDLRVPTTDFDFQSANARFDKSSVGPTKQNKEKEKNGDDSTQGEGFEDGGSKEKEEEVAYDPKKSFFDSLSSSASGSTQGGGQGGGRGRGRGGRSRREEEREKNVATFGEPGGIGLMGPGGGGRGRRGGVGTSR
ncbi:hypothetical protein BDM02DRAFT_3154276 [Thelephora ganbajun]|uniref:Uncharacterized protein n=1 Tax=Thelephora ganbajun TaxID=370292 RepID=A0ACB6ZPD8_THEGA|nr:hypothetical protein BDM02DRAFT_3154276 [Thelephora ganbajun]